MSLESFASFISSTITPLSLWLAEKAADRFGGPESNLRQVVIRSLAFVLLLIPIALVGVMMVGMTIFSFQMLYAGI